MAKPLGGTLKCWASVRLSVCPSVYHKTCYRDNFRFHTPIFTVFDPVLHTTIALDEFEDE